VRSLDQPMQGAAARRVVYYSMTHDYPSSLPLTLAQSPAVPAAARRPLPAVTASFGAWRYPGAPRSRVHLVLALLISASLHAGALFSVRRQAPAAPLAAKEHLLALSIPLPDIKDLEEPEPVLDPTAEKPDPGEYAPSLMDAPQIALPTDFVQELNFASLLPRPDLAEAKVFVIPHNILHSGKLGAGFGNIFNLADLDRVPEPLVQASPVFPPALRREVSHARVVVEFIVDTEGRVLQPVVVECSYPGFEDAAAAGVSRWRFRPGMKGGRKVNTRMSVPIIFLTKDADS
jgi:protein TonB